MTETGVVSIHGNSRTLDSQWKVIDMDKEEKRAKIGTPTSTSCIIILIIIIIIIVKIVSAALLESTILLANA